METKIDKLCTALYKAVRALPEKEGGKLQIAITAYNVEGEGFGEGDYGEAEDLAAILEAIVSGRRYRPFLFLERGNAMNTNDAIQYCIETVFFRSFYPLNDSEKAEFGSICDSEKAVILWTGNESYGAAAIVLDGETLTFDLPDEDTRLVFRVEKLKAPETSEKYLSR